MREMHGTPLPKNAKHIFVKLQNTHLQNCQARLCKNTKHTFQKLQSTPSKNTKNTHPLNILGAKLEVFELIHNMEGLYGDS